MSTLTSIPGGRGPAVVPEGERIGRYLLQRVLGRGALATVHLAFDPKLGRQVAIKILETDGDEELRRRFKLEAQAIAALEHPNIVRFVDFSDEDSPVSYLVMEYVPGPSLEQLLAERGMVSEQTALCVGHQIAGAIAYLHDSRVLHRDIKPSNVILSGGRVVLVDFGGTKLLDKLRGRSVATQVVGTPGFMAPEQFAGKRVTERTDLFAVGALMYNLTTNALPYSGRDVNENFVSARKGRYIDPRDRQPLLTPAFCGLLGDCLATKPSDRPKGAAELVGRIEELLVAHGVGDVPLTLSDLERGSEQTIGLQEERSVDTLVEALRTALLRDLVVATRDKRSEHAASIVERLRLLAKVERQPFSTSKDSRRVRVLRRTGRRRWFAWLIGGLLLGGILTEAAYWAKGQLGLRKTESAVHGMPLAEDRSIPPNACGLVDTD
ncbi:serine/threonine-protein kinase [Myxococcota bacterium]